MVHVFEISDADGCIDDVIYFCSDVCHREWCDEEPEARPYGGWNGAHELPYTVECETCRKTMEYVEP